MLIAANGLPQLFRGISHAVTNTWNCSARGGRPFGASLVSNPGIINTKKVAQIRV